MSISNHQNVIEPGSKRAKEAGRILVEALGDWHPPEYAGGQAHKSFSDSLALTHCICFGGGGQVLRFLLEHPERFQAALAASNEGRL